MPNFTTSRSLLAVSAITFGLLPLVGTAEAKSKAKGGPPAHAPAYGRRDRDRDDDRDDDRNRGRVRYDNFGRTVTLEAIVTSVDDFNRNGNNNFRVQAGGRSFDVTSDQNVRVRVGQRVILRGSFDQDDNFNARSVSVAGRANDNRNDNDPYGDDYRPGSDRRVNFPGVVTRVFSNGELEVRAENGRTYRVEPRSDSNDFRVGSRVRVTGTANGTRVQNARLILQNGSGGIFGNGGDYGDYGGSTRQRVSFSARIIRIGSDRRSATVRGDNGREYTIRSADLKNYRNGERVRLSGTARYGTIEVSNISRI